ncbi:MAG: fumarate/nitrate reduction transcriptional regulator Fnr [Betaproteobacteria bacterium]|nr:fumarate/nitrate reduction transcriptional regulator Fnr [Betaproteobacteria bacterium]
MEPRCANCCMRSVCLPCRLDDAELEKFDDLVCTTRRVARGQTLYRAGDKFEMLYAVHSGSFKSACASRHGAEKITGFHFPGELMGMEAISRLEHNYDAIALEDSEVCVLPFAALEAAARRMPELQRQLLRVLSGDISRDQGLMLMLGGMSAEQRLAAFLLSLSRRYGHMGYDPERFVLRMTREEIGNYLGLSTETVSRLFSQMARDGLLGVNQREVELKESEALMELVGY